MPLFRSSSKTPKETVSELREALLYLAQQTTDGSSKWPKKHKKSGRKHEQSDVDLAKAAREETAALLVALKNILHGSELQKVQLDELVKQCFDSDILLYLVRGSLLEELPSPTARRDVVRVFRYFLERETDSTVKYIIKNQVLISNLISGYATGKPQVVANCGLMLRACTRYKSLVWVILLLKSDDVLQFFDFMQAKQFEVLADAFVTFKELLKHEDLTTKFLEENHEEIFKRLSEVLSSDYYVTKHVCLEWLQELLKESICMREYYCRSSQSLKTVMTLLGSDPSVTIRFKALDLLQVFLMVTEKERDVCNILLSNREKMEALVSELLTKFDKDAKHCPDPGRKFLLKTLEDPELTPALSELIAEDESLTNGETESEAEEPHPSEPLSEQPLLTEREEPPLVEAEQTDKEHLPSQQFMPNEPTDGGVMEVLPVHRDGEKTQEGPCIEEQEGLGVHYTQPKEGHVEVHTESEDALNDPTDKEEPITEGEEQLPNRPKGEEQELDQHKQESLPDQPERELLPEGEEPHAQPDHTEGEERPDDHHEGDESRVQLDDPDEKEEPPTDYYEGEEKQSDHHGEEKSLPGHLEQIELLPNQREPLPDHNEEEKQMSDHPDEQEPLPNCPEEEEPHVQPDHTEVEEQPDDHHEGEPLPNSAEGEESLLGDYDEEEPQTQLEPPEPLPDSPQGEEPLPDQEQVRDHHGEEEPLSDHPEREEPLPDQLEVQLLPDGSEGEEIPPNHSEGEPLPDHHNGEEQYVQPGCPEGEEQTPDHHDGEPLLPNTLEGDASLLDNNEAEPLPDHGKEEQISDHPEEEPLPNCAEEEELADRHNEGEEPLADHTERIQPLPDQHEAEEPLTDHSKEEVTLPDHSKEEVTLPDHFNGELHEQLEHHEDEEQTPDDHDGEEPLPDHSEGEELSADHREGEVPPPDQHDGGEPLPDCHKGDQPPNHSEGDEVLVDHDDGEPLPAISEIEDQSKELGHDEQCEGKQVLPVDKEDLLNHPELEQHTVLQDQKEDTFLDRSEADESSPHHSDQCEDKEPFPSSDLHQSGDEGTAISINKEEQDQSKEEFPSNQLESSSQNLELKPEQLLEQISIVLEKSEVEDDNHVKEENLMKQSEVLEDGEPPSTQAKPTENTSEQSSKPNEVYEPKSAENETPKTSPPELPREELKPEQTEEHQEEEKSEKIQSTEETLADHQDQPGEDDSAKEHFPDQSEQLPTAKLPTESGEALIQI